MNSMKLKSFLTTVCYVFFALFSDSQSMDADQQYIERGRKIFKSLNEDWDISRKATVAVAGELLKQSLSIERFQELDENTRNNIRMGLLACVGLIALSHAHIAVQNMETHGNWSVFSNIEAQLEPTFYKRIGKKYSDKDEIILETLKQVSYFGGLEDNIVKTFIPFSWFIPEFRIALNTKLEKFYGINTVFDCENRRITDQTIQSYLCKIKSKLANTSVDRDIRISFKENYLESKGIIEILEFCNTNEYLKKNITHLDLSNNRGTNDVLPKALEVLGNCQKLNCIDLSINYIDWSVAQRVVGSNTKIKFFPF